MKTLTRQEVKQAFKEIVEKYGNPKTGDIYCEDQLISAIAKNLCAFDETYITYENGKFEVSPSVSIKKEYSDDYNFIGKIKAEEWYTEEQRRAMHEIAFGYQF